MLKGIKIPCCILFGALLAAISSMTNACSRFTYNGPDNTVTTGRSMDWMEDLQTDIWAFPVGTERIGNNTPNSVKWSAKYGSVIASGYNIGTTDGINSEGLNVNLLFLATTNYGASQSNRKDLSVFNWAQYVLDNFATVDEAVKDLSQDKFNMIAPVLPHGVSPTLHLSITDPSGDNAIFEYIDGKLVIHHSKEFKVMTNEPSYDKQLTLNDYWQRLDGKFIPGTGEPDDRFVRASYYVNTALSTADEQKAVATVFSIIRNVSVPMQAGTPSQPNVAATIWRSVADLKHKIYFFENADRPNVFWVELDKLDLKKNAPIKKLPLQHGEVYAGEVSKNMVASKPFFSE
jgi:penicillin V acylase-like amidase (Ntn superfamily)